MRLATSRGSKPARDERRHGVASRSCRGAGAGSAPRLPVNLAISTIDRSWSNRSAINTRSCAAICAKAVCKRALESLDALAAARHLRSRLPSCRCRSRSAAASSPTSVVPHADGQLFPDAAEFGVGHADVVIGAHDFHRFLERVRVARHEPLEQRPRPGPSRSAIADGRQRPHSSAQKSSDMRSITAAR